MLCCARETSYGFFNFSSQITTDLKVASGLFPLKEGALLKIAVGQRGSFRGSGFIPGGGGGTFVISGASGGRGMIDWEANTSLIVAGN